MGKITVVGLGPGASGLITLEAWNKMQQADNLILRTAVHPTVAKLDAENIKYTSCDSFYEQGASFEEVYTGIAKKLI